MGEAQIILERHEQRLNTLERDVQDLQDAQAEIHEMNETLVSLTSELRHTNENLARNEKKIDLIESQPRLRMQQIVTAIIAALAGAIISAISVMMQG